MKPEDQVGVLEELRQRANTEFQKALEKVRREAWETTLRRIGGVLTDRQRARYEEMLGARFHLSTLRLETIGAQPRSSP